MKKGDKILCKKTLRNKEIAFGFGGSGIRVEKNKYYTVDDIVGKGYFLFIEGIWFFKNGFDIDLLEDPAFLDDPAFSKSLNEYFYTEKEMRRFKLNQIDAIGRTN